MEKGRWKVANNFIYIKLLRLSLFSWFKYIEELILYDPCYKANGITLASQHISFLCTASENDIIAVYTSNDISFFSPIHLLNTPSAKRISYITAFLFYNTLPKSNFPITVFKDCFWYRMAKIYHPVFHLRITKSMIH